MKSLPEIIHRDNPPPNTPTKPRVGRYAWEPEHSFARETGRTANPYCGDRTNTSKRAVLTAESEGTEVVYWTPETLAKAWADAPHEPDHPAWSRYVRELDSFATQYAGGFIEVAEEEPYATATEMRRVWESGRAIRIASSANVRWKIGHPLAEHRRNFWARAVHDYYGHILVDNPFGFIGEILAYRAESQHFPEVCYPALFGEVVGQAAYHEVYGRFPDVQKCAVIEPRRVLV